MAVEAEVVGSDEEVEVFPGAQRNVSRRHWQQMLHLFKRWLTIIIYIW